jgi:SagB-type dehydrogenase family enzyme
MPFIINSVQRHKMITLPEPTYEGKISLEAALKARKSIRLYSTEPLLTDDVSQLLWAAQGLNRKNRMRTAPSAGALYPLEVYLVAGLVQDLQAGVYRYHPFSHELDLVESGDKRRELAISALHQDCIERGAISLVLAGVYERTSMKYGSRAERYVHIEIGHAAQNIYLQAVSLDLGTVMVGAFHDEKVQQTLSMRRNESPLCIMPVGNLR